MEEAQERTPRYRRSYKIQEVIKRRQIMLVQVVKEERGTKGAALTTYLSLAGRYSVLMPNTARGGGISRKITNSLDRKKLKEIAQDLEVPEGMGVILRTAGANRTKTEVKRDFEYLLRMWETVRDFTLKSTAPTLVYEEGSLIKRSIRDLYNKDIEEILVAGEHGHREARDFMRMLMPSHAKNVKLYQDAQPVFTRYGIESQLDAMFTPTVQLRSGGYIVINQTEALVAIDVNSGRATREHHIEDTATKTNCEAAEEVARQLRLRDLAGLIVIDFIDMDEHRNNRTVERRLKEALKNDRARIQVGRISHFGLMEMSRQRIRSSVLESSTDKCPHCGGTGHVRSVSSVTLHMLRMIEEMLLKGATHNIVVRTRSEVALYVLNHKRAHLRDLESRFQITITVNADASVGAAQPFLIEKGEQVHSVEAAKAILAQQQQAAPAAAHEEDELDESVEDEVEESEDEGETEAVSERESESEDDEAKAKPPRDRPSPPRRAARTVSGAAAAAVDAVDAADAADASASRAKAPLWAKARRMHRSSTHRVTATTRAKAMAPLRKVKRRKKDSRTDRTPVPASRAESATAMDAAAGVDAVADAATAAAARANPDMPARTAGKRADRTASTKASTKAKSSTASSRKSRTPSRISADRRAKKRRSPLRCTRRSHSSRSRARRRPCRPRPSPLLRHRPSRRSAARPCASPRRCFPPAR